ncbi:ABC transporter permease [Halobacterium sp. DL1]|jgi:peptide/nickel transport system permease protein|nr:ABC transporter permease [Halobacterium sp. DL1]
MSFASYVGRRTLFALFTIYLVVTATFAVVALTPDTQIGAMKGSMQRAGVSSDVIEERVQAYKEARGLDDPLHVRYADWLVDVSTLNFGRAHSMNAQTAAVLWPAIQRTALYTIPALAFALVLGTLFGGLSGSLSGSVPDWAVRVVGYGAVGVPAFMTAYVLLEPFASSFEWVRLLTWKHTPFDSLGRVALPNHGLWPPSEPLRFLVPAAVFAVALLGWQVRYVRTSYLDRAGQESVKLLRAKGAGRLKIARHVLRNAAVPIVSASLSELLVVVLLNIYIIETVFGIEGVAALNMIGVRQREMSLIIGTSLVLAVGGVLASYVQDLLYGYLDPRIGTE